MLNTLISIFRDGSLSPDEFIVLLITFVSYAMIILVALPVHELSHGLMAYKLGDNTAKWNGRLTMNPFAHMDPIGTLMIFLVGFGYAKPVPVNPRNFRNYQSGMMLTSLAGPLSNMLMAIVSLGLFRLAAFLITSGTALYFVGIFLTMFAQINVGLAIFNLLPIPPLDGFRIVASLLPPRWTYFVDRYQMMITMAVLLLIFSGALSGPLDYLISAVYDFYIRVLGLQGVLNALFLA